jgi:histidyl-tRNA synthetase
MTVGPPTGMRDWLPRETAYRQQLMETIGSVYRLYGYLPIDTPAMEDLSVLQGKGGGENEKLLFKILKRGDKLARAQAEGAELADYGLRFDLTVPLARFVASHQGKLPKVFRRYHIAPVWRADRPQLGRYREFYQCDIDVVGGAGPAYEAEVITATERVLAALKLETYRFRVSDKRLLPLILRGFDVAEDRMSPVLIALDKLDKVGSGQILAELQEALSSHQDAYKRVARFFEEACEARLRADLSLDRFEEHMDSALSPAVMAEIRSVLLGLRGIMESVRFVNPSSAVLFDPILVRGMDYYTGPIYEAVVEGFSSSILGGGRCDGLIGRFLGTPVPAVGCSIGFERILAIQQQRDAGGMTGYPRALLLRTAGDDVGLQAQAEKLRNAGIPVETYLDPEDMGKQLKHAEAQGIVWAIKEVKDDFSLIIRHLPTRQDRAMSLAEFQILFKG